MKNLKKFGLVLGIIISTGLFTECNSNEKKDIKENIDLNIGSIVKTEKGENSNLNLENDSYKKVSNDEVVIEYSKDKSYVYLSNEKHFVKRKNEIIEINNDKYNNLNLSQTGNYIGYIIDDAENELKIIDLEKNKEIKLKSNVIISGEFFDFTNEDSIIYYGISEEGENGVFIYDLKTNEEKMIYKIEKGYVEFLKVLDDEVIILNNSVEDGKYLKTINLKTKETKILSDKVDKLSDIQKNNNKYYFLGSIKTDGDSLYLISDNDIERIVFDFPNEISLESKLSKNYNGEILFMGKNVGDSGMEIYSYNLEDGVKLIEDKEGTYNFIRFD